MKKGHLAYFAQRLIAVFVLTLIMTLGLSVTVFAAEKCPTEEEVYQAIIALKEDYPEGMPWTNENAYTWKGGIFNTGFGCAGFAFICSDAAFGNLPTRMIEDVTIKDIRVGDILRINGNTHSVVALEIYDDYIVVTEGNYNFSIHWGRVLSAEEVAECDYIMTRYPESNHIHSKYYSLYSMPTCTEPGEESFYCYECEKWFVEEIDALGHDYEDSYTIDKKATYKSNGKKSIHCKNCDATTSEKTIAKLTPKTQKISMSSTVEEGVTCKYKTLKNKAVTYEIAAKAYGAISYEVTEGDADCISVSSKGVITLKKGCKKGHYEVTVTAAATKSGKYKKAKKVIEITVK